MRHAFVCAIALAAMGFAEQPVMDQSAVSIEGQSIVVKYAAPSMQGRKIFGAAVPYGKVWRVGDNSAVALHSDSDLVFKGVAVPKGDYTLYVLVDAGKWQLIINKQTGPRAVNYDPKLDVGRVPMNLGKSSAAVETCRIALSKTAARAAKIEITWDHTVASAPFHLDRVAGDSEW